MVLEIEQKAQYAMELLDDKVIAADYYLHGNIIEAVFDAGTGRALINVNESRRDIEEIIESCITGQSS